MFANFPLSIRIFSLLVFTFCSLLLSLKSYSVTPQALTPLGTVQTTTPKFAAVGSSLLPGVAYFVAISETPRGGTYGQYLDRWVKEGLTANGLVWDSSWQQRSRLNGNPDGPPVVVSDSSPPTLTPGKTYYWHIVGDNGTYRSEEASFTVANSTVATPQISPNGGVFGQPTLITITTSTPDAVIYFSTDGSTPSMYTGTYVGPLLLQYSATIKALAVKTGMTKSSVSSATITLETRSPIITPSGGSISDETEVAITSPTSGATVYYTLDGTTPTTRSRVYEVPFRFGAGSTVTVKSFAVRSLWGPSPVSTAEFTIPSQVVAPTINPGGGVFVGEPTVNISTPIAGAAIYYTLDGTNPSVNSLLYSAPFILNRSATVKAIAVKSGMANSTVSSSTITLEPITPRVSPEGGIISNQTQISLSSSTGVAIYYTIDGSTPTANSILYTAPFKLNNSATVKAIAIKSGWSNSFVRSIDFTIPAQVVAPTINPGGGVFVGEPTVNISTSITGAEIYYTLDGTNPSVNSLLYSAPFILNRSATIKAIAVKSGMANSTVSSSTITLEPITPRVSPEGGVISNQTQISLSSSTGVAIYYTIDGSTPTANSILYTAPFKLNNSATVKAIAIKSGWSNSFVRSIDFTIPAPIQPKALTPIGTIQTTTPNFAAVGSSLLPGVAYFVAISESPRGGSYGQYLDRWVKDGLTANGLLWDSSWQQRSRLNGDPDGPPIVISESSPPTLTPGKTYYWHIVGDNGTYKSEEASFTVGKPPSQPALTVKPNTSRNVFEISWSSVSDVNHYELQRNGVTIYTGALLKQDVSVPAYDTTYTFTLKACNAIGCSVGNSAPGIMPAPIQPKALTPTGTIQTTTPNFAAVGSSLLPGVAYFVAISESPRGGTYGQYLDRWVKDGLTANGLLWDSSWQQRSRLNGDPDGPPIVISESSPPTLTPGKTYYWHIVGDNGTYKSEEASFTVDVNTQPVFANLEIDNVNNFFKISWEDVSAYKYELEYSGASSPATGVGVPTQITAGGTQGWGQSFIQSINATGGTPALNNADGVAGAIGVAGRGTSTWDDDEIQNGESLAITFTAPVIEANFGFAKLDYNLSAGHQIGVWIAFLKGIEVGRGEFQPTDATRTGLVQVKNTSGNFIAFDQIRFQPAKQGSDYVVTSFSAVLSSANVESLGANWYRGPTVFSGSSATVSKSSVTDFAIYQWRVKACNSSNVCSAWTETLKKTFTFSHPIVIAPKGTIQTTTPKFAAVESSLLTGVVYGVAISESPRTGTYGQYFDWWVKTDLTANDLVESNPNGLVWNSGWQQRTRNGNPDGPPFVVGNSSPLSLTPGKTYYWHIVGDNGTYKSEQASFTVDVNAQPSVNSSGNFDFKASQNIHSVKFDLSWKPQTGHTRYELWKRSSVYLPDLYDESKWINYSVSQAEYNAGGVSVPFSTMPNDVYAQWKLVVCDTQNICKSQLSRVKVIRHNTDVTSTNLLSPSNNTIVDYNRAQSDLCFSWSADPNAVKYGIAISDTPEFFERRWQQLVDANVTNLCWGDVNDWNRTGVYRNELTDDLIIGKTYYWRVGMNYADGREGITATRQFTLTTSLPTLSVTTDVFAQKFKLEWNSVNTAQFYQLQVRVGNDVAGVESATPRDITLPNQLAITIDESMASYKDYAMIQWQVRACQSASNCGVWQKSRIKTNQYSAIASGVSLLAPIRLASIDVAIDKSKPCFKWASDSNATDYVVSVSDTPEFNDRSWAKAISNATTTCWDNANGWARAGIYKDDLQEGLYRGFKYYWRVVSRYSNGTLGFSQTYSFDITDSSTPVIALLSPKPLESKRVFVGSNVPVMANVFDNYMRNWRNLDGRQPVVDYYINNTQLPKAFRIPAGTPVNWFADKAGVYKLKAVAYLDDAKTLKTLEAEVTVVEPQKPTLTIQTNGSANVGSATELKVVATDLDQQIEEVSFYANGEPIGKTSNQPPYATKWTPVVAGNYQLSAKLLDKRGNEIVSPAITALVQPTIFSLDGIDKPSEFGATSVAKGWLVRPLTVSDVLSVKPANNHRISYNKLDQLILNRPLNIINRSDVYDNGIVPQLIVLDADLIDLKSGIEIIGEPADLLIINSSGSNAIRCENCGFINVQRAVLAVATPSTALSSAIAAVGELQTRAAGVVDINNLQASGVVSLDIIADKVIAKGHIDTQQYARQSTEINAKTGNAEQVLDFVATPLINSVVVGSGGVSLLQGNLRVKYETMELENAVAGTGVMAVNAAISSGAINVFATDAIQLNGDLSTKSSHRAAQIYRGQLRAQEEKIELKSIAQASVAPSLRINGLVFSDAKVNVISHSAEIAPNGGIQAHSVKAELVGQLTNRGYIRGYARSTAANLANGDAMIQLGLGALDNRGEIRGVFNDLRAAGGNTSVEGKINIASEGDVYNRFGGVITAKEIKVYAKGKIRNGSLFAFDATAPGGKELTTPITLVRHDTEALSTHTTLSFSASEPALKNTTASILGADVTLEAKKSIENINPYTEPHTSAAVEISALSESAEARANDVQIEATQKLQIFTDTYLLNSSARLGVSESRIDYLLSIKAPSIRNERYYSRMIIETFSDSETVQKQNSVSITNWAKGAQSRYGFYSPPGYIYSFSKAEFNFGVNGDGLVNNLSYVDLYGDLHVFGKGNITTRGISLEKMGYEAGTTTSVSLAECRSAARYTGQQYGYRYCDLRQTYTQTPEGKLLKQSPDNTLFAVNGQIKAAPSVFSARNDQSLTVLRKKLIAEYINEQTLLAAKLHENDIRLSLMNPACIQTVSFEEKDNVLLGSRKQFSENPQVRCYNVAAFGMRTQGSYQSPIVHEGPFTWSTHFVYKNITELVNEKMPDMNTALNQQINEYRAWRNAAQ